MKQRESSETVKGRILETAARLFAQHGVGGVSIRMIAAEAGINHALIIRHFGSKDALVAEILKRRISSLAGAYPVKPGQIPAKTLEKLREILLNTLTDEKETMQLVVRSGIDGLSPESYLDGKSERAAGLIAGWIKSQQAGGNLPDAKLVSLVITGAMFSLVSIAPWLMTAVGLAPEDFERRKQDIMDVIIWMIARAIGLPEDSQTNINI